MEAFTTFINSITDPQYLSWGDVIVRIALATLLGFFLGLEREISHHPAGMKTHLLVCLGSTLASLIACEMGYNVADMPEAGLDLSRIASGVVSGMGFIGAGAIMKSRDGTMVTGITTAATLWVSACLGLAIGMGYYHISIMTFGVVLGATILLKFIEKKLFIKKRERSIEITFTDKKVTMPLIEKLFEQKKVSVQSFEYKIYPDQMMYSGEIVHHCRYNLTVPRSLPIGEIIKGLVMLENIVEVFETLHGKEGSLDYRKPEEESLNE